MRFTWLAKPSRFHMVCETMKRFTWFVEPCEIRTIKPIKFHMDPTKPCEITDPYGSLSSFEYCCRTVYYQARRTLGV